MNFFALQAVLPIALIGSFNFLLPTNASSHADPIDEKIMAFQEIVSSDPTTFSHVDNIEYLGSNDQSEYWRFTKRNEICISQLDITEADGIVATTCERKEIAKRQGIELITASVNDDSITVEDAWFPGSNDPGTIGDDPEIRIKETNAPAGNIDEQAVLESIDNAQTELVQVQPTHNKTVLVELIDGQESELSTD